MSEELTGEMEFDFDAHAAAAVAKYRMIRPTYEQLADVAKRILNDALHVESIRFHSIEARAKPNEF